MFRVLIPIGNSTLKWITPATQGQSPNPRFLHTMIYCRKLNILVIHGGRNDGSLIPQKFPFLGDCWVLQLDNLMWVSVVIAGGKDHPKCSHAAAVVGTKMIVFGGIYYNTYCSPDQKVFEMDQIVANNLTKDRKESEVKSPEPTDLDLRVEQMIKEKKKNYKGIVTFLPMPNKDHANRRLVKKHTKTDLSKTAKMTDVDSFR